MTKHASFNALPMSETVVLSSQISPAMCGNCTCLRGCQQQIAPRPLLRALLVRARWGGCSSHWLALARARRTRAALHTHTHTHRCRRQLARRVSPAAPQSRLHCRPRHPRGALPAKLNPWAKSAPQKDILSPYVVRHTGPSASRARRRSTRTRSVCHFPVAMRGSRA